MISQFAMLVYQRVWYNTYMCVSKIGMILMGDISYLFHFVIIVITPEAFQGMLWP